MYEYSSRNNNDNLRLKEEMQTPANISATDKVLQNRDLLTGVSHELRTHMNAIVAFSFLMKEKDVNGEEINEFSDHIIDSCEQLVNLFDNFLDSAALDSGTSQPEIRSCNPESILMELRSEFRTHLNKRGNKEISVILDSNMSDQGNINIEADRVVRVIQNLFRNALQNTNSGYIKIGYFFREDKVTFYVLDSGQGYFKSKELLQANNINEFLFKHNDTYTTVSLTLARKLVTLMRGNIRIEPNGISGSGIYFSVPYTLSTEIPSHGNSIKSNKKIAI